MVLSAARGVLPTTTKSSAEKAKVLHGCHSAALTRNDDRVVTLFLRPDGER
jgi:hypothetical protein